MLPDKAIKVANIDPIENTTYVTVRGDLSIDPPKTIYTDNITPHLKEFVQSRVLVNGNMDIEGDLSIDPLNTIWTDNITPHFKPLVQPRVKVNGNLDIQGTLTTTGPTTITPGTTSNVYSKTEVDTTKAPLSNPTFTGNVTCTNGLTVSGTSTFNSGGVEILAPLKIKCLQTNIEKGLLVGELLPVEAIGIYVSNNAIINRNLTVNQNLTVAGNTTFTGTVSGIPIGGATQAAIDLKADTS